MLAGLVGDWVTFAIFVAADFAILWAATLICRRRADRYWSAALVAFSVVFAGMLIAVNLRWGVWTEAYRETGAYDPRNDVSLVVINEVVLGLYVVVAMALLWRRAWGKKHPNHSPHGSAD